MKKAHTLTADDIIKLAIQKYFHIPFFSDYGFKAAWLRCSLFPRRALQVLLQQAEPILRLDFIRNESGGLTFESKGGIFDVICRDERLRVFIIEMQAEDYEFIIPRLVFYAAQEYCALIPKGNVEDSFGNLPPVHCICIIKGSFWPGENYHQTFSFKNESGEDLFPGIKFHFFELGKFLILRSKWKTIKTDLEKLLYVMKYAHRINGKDKGKRPDFCEEPWISEVLHELELSKMTAQERAIVEMALVKEASIRQGERLRLERAKEKGKLEGKLEGKDETNFVAIRNMTKKKFPTDTIAGVLEVPISKVIEVQDLLKKEPKIIVLLTEGRLEDAKIAAKLKVPTSLVQMVKSEIALKKQ